jgi:hypothetical protein
MTSDRRALSFTAHQIAEYVVGGVTVLQSGHLGGHGASAVVGLGVAIVVVAAVSGGPVGALRWVSPAAHRALDVGLIAVAVASPWLFAFTGDLAAILVAESVGILLLVLSGATRYRRWPAVAARTPRRPRTRADDASRVAGFVAGRVARRVRRD